MTNANDNQDQEFLLSQYLDGTLDEPARLEVERRLKQDPRLADLLEQLRRTDQLVTDWAGPRPELNWERFALEATRRREDFESARRRQRVFRLFAPLSAAAAIILLVAVLQFVARPAPTDMQQPQQVAQTEPGGADRGVAFAQVTLVRTPGLEVVDTTARMATVAVAAAGAAPTHATFEEQTPYF
jgi:anti-sigma factor RsiW